VSSLQSFGGTAFTPIINLPELAILGLSQIQERAAPGPSGGITWRKKLPLSMSYDHRVINGAAAAKFVAHLRQSLESPESLGLIMPNRKGAL
jgi:pyruvate dehydrogenase E2 component (dihydrolipoamide acetyltransferase)